MPSSLTMVAEMPQGRNEGSAHTFRNY